MFTVPKKIETYIPSKKAQMNQRYRNTNRSFESQICLKLGEFYRTKRL